jgi:hypothetical protein
LRVLLESARTGDGPARNRTYHSPLTFSEGWDDTAADEETNLWLACPICNGHKSDKTSAADPETGEIVALFNPRTQHWREHFRWSEDGIRIVGLTPVGRATVIALHLADDPEALRVRTNWVSAGWHPTGE